MQRVVDPVALEYAKSVDALLTGGTGVGLAALQSDLKAALAGGTSLSQAFRSGVTAEAFADGVRDALGLSPASDFEKPGDAGVVNVRRAALATLAREGDGWARHGGALYRQAEDGVQRLSVATSRDGAWGFGIDLAADATMPSGTVESIDLAAPDGSTVATLTYVSIPHAPEGEFRHVASGIDIKDALEGYERDYEPAAPAHGPTA